MQEFLDPLRVERLWGVGKQSSKVFERLGIRTIGHLRQCPLDILQTRFGSSGEHLWNLAHGRDNRAVVPEREAKSISHETTFEHDIIDMEVDRMMDGGIGFSYSHKVLLSGSFNMHGLPVNLLGTYTFTANFQGAAGYGSGSGLPPGPGQWRYAGESDFSGLQNVQMLSPKMPFPYNGLIVAHEFDSGSAQLPSPSGSAALTGNISGHGSTQTLVTTLGVQIVPPPLLGSPVTEFTLRDQHFSVSFLSIVQAAVKASGVAAPGLA